MKLLLNLKSLIAILAIVFSISSCGWGHKKAAPTGKNIVCVVDFSDSKNVAERLQFYMKVIKDNIIPVLGQYDKITVIPIDKTSITNSSDILIADLSKEQFVPENASPVEEDELIQANLKKYTTALQAEFVKNFQVAIANRSKDNHGTDIFGALDGVQTKFKNNKDNYLILLSDMMNWSSTLKMEPADIGFNTGSCENILTKVPSYEMPNTTALVLTAEQIDVSPEHFQLVRSFWTKYFEKNKINLYDYNSASVAKLNEMMAIQVIQSKE